jgi:hypothetical protein
MQRAEVYIQPVVNASHTWGHKRLLENITNLHLSCSLIFRYVHIPILCNVVIELSMTQNKYDLKLMCFVNLLLIYKQHHIKKYFKRASFRSERLWTEQGIIIFLYIFLLLTSYTYLIQSPNLVDCQLFIVNTTQLWTSLANNCTTNTLHSYATLFD